MNKRKILNPSTGRFISYGGVVHKRLIKSGKMENIVLEPMKHDKKKKLKVSKFKKDGKTIKIRKKEKANERAKENPKKRMKEQKLKQSKKKRKKTSKRMKDLEKKVESSDSEELSSETLESSMSSSAYESSESE